MFPFLIENFLFCTFKHCKDTEKIRRDSFIYYDVLQQRDDKKKINMRFRYIVNHSLKTLRLALTAKTDQTS